VRPLVNPSHQASNQAESSWKAILECAAMEVFEMMAGVHLEPNPEPGEEPSGEQTAMVGMAGALCGMITLRCSQEMSKRFASLMLGEAAAANPTTARDALGELCNMVAGNFKGKINALKDQCMLSVPTVISGEDYSMDTADPNEGITIAFTCDGNLVWVCLIVQP